MYYWQRASREDTVQVKLETPDDEATTGDRGRGERTCMECWIGLLSCFDEIWLW